MKTKLIEIKDHKTVYVAVDGTEFDSEQECLKYEKTFNCVMRSYLKKMAINIGSEEDLFNTGSCENDVYVVIPKNEEDIIHIKQVVLGTGQKEDYVEKWMEKVVPGKVVLVTIGYNFDWAYIDTLDKLMERITAGKFQVTECK